MASVYSNLKIELIGLGGQDGTWGNTLNTNLGVAIDEAIAGRANPVMGNSNLTLSFADSNASQVARHYILNVTSSVTLTATRDLIVPAINKPYIIENNTTGTQSVRVKTAAGTGVTVPNGKRMMVYVDGTNVVPAFNELPAGVSITGLGDVVGTTTTQTLTNKTINIANNTLTGVAPLASPALSGTPTAPTATAGTNTTQVATTAFTGTAITNERTATATLTNKSLTSPSLTGTPTAPTATAGTNTTQVATTAFTTTAISNERAAPATLTNKTITSPTLNGTPTAPTATAGTNTTQIATTAFTGTAITNERTAVATLTNKSLTSPNLTGTPTAPTATSGTNTTQIATTAFVQNVAGNLGTMSTQNSNNVTITGGAITGTTVNGVVVGTNARGARTVSTATPTGGVDGDVWYQF